MADQLAEDGFIALAPDLLSGLGPNGGGTGALGTEVTKTIRALTPEQVASRLDVVRDDALRLPSANGRSVAPVLGFSGADDARVNATIPAAEAEMKKAGKTFAANLREEAGHGFLRQPSGREGANRRAAEKAREATLGFLRDRLK